MGDAATFLFFTLGMAGGDLILVVGGLRLVLHREMCLSMGVPKLAPPLNRAKVSVCFLDARAQ